MVVDELGAILFVKPITLLFKCILLPKLLTTLWFTPPIELKIDVGVNKGFKGVDVFDDIEAAGGDDDCLPIKLLLLLLLLLFLKDVVLGRIKTAADALRREEEEEDEEGKAEEEEEEGDDDVEEEKDEDGLNGLTLAEKE
jgi:hypothetical protein